MSIKQADPVLTFLNAVTPRVGPANAIGLLKDVQLAAVIDILKSKLGVSQETIDKTVEAHMKKTAQDVVKSTPVPSPIQRLQ